MQVRSAAFLFVAWLGCAAGLAAEVGGEPERTVGRYGDLATLEFAGNQHFSSHEIWQALARDFKVQEACRPSAPLSELVEQLEARLVEGYHYSGCPDVKVSVSPAKGEHLVVHVEEGTCYMAGDVRVRGTSKLDESSLVASLAGAVDKLWSIPNVTLRQGDKVVGPVDAEQEEVEGKPTKKDGESEYEQSYWTHGEPVRFGGASTDSMRPRVAEALLRQGYPEARFRLEIEPNDEKKLADLVIEVEELGPPSMVEEVTIEGLERHTRAQLLELMQIAEGQQIDTKLLEEALNRVRESCRFWDCDITIDYPTPLDEGTAPARENGGETRLLIEVIEYPYVAPLGEPLSEIDEILRGAAVWLRELHTQQEWELQGELAAGETYRGSKAEFWLSPIEGMMFDLRLAGSPAKSTVKLDGEYRILLGPTSLVLADIGHGDRVSTNISAHVAPRLQLTPGAVKEGDFSAQLNFFFGVSSDSKSNQLIRVDPIALVDLAHNKGVQCEIKEGVLSIREEDRFEVWFEVRFDAATGRLLNLETGHGERKGIRLATVPRNEAGWRGREAEIASYLNRWDSERPLVSLIDYSLDIASRATKDETLAADSKRAALRQLVESRPFAALEWFLLNKFFDNEPAIPVATFQLPDTWKAHQDPKYSFAGLPDHLFVRETWPWSLSREASYFLIRRGSAHLRAGRTAELERVLARDDTGPICHWVLGKVGQTDKYTARRALEMLDEDVFEREIAMLTTPGTGLWEMLEWLVPLAQATTDEEIDKFLSPLTGSFDRPVLQVAQLLRRLDATSEPALRESLAQMLRTDLRPLVEADLQKLAAGWGKANRPTFDLSRVGEPFPATTEKKDAEEKKPAAPAEPKILGGVLPFEELGVGDQPD